MGATLVPGRCPKNFSVSSAAASASSWGPTVGADVASARAIGTARDGPGSPSDPDASFGSMRMRGSPSRSTAALRSRASDPAGDLTHNVRISPSVAAAAIRPQNASSDAARSWAASPSGSFHSPCGPIRSSTSGTNTTSSTPIGAVATASRAERATGVAPSVRSPHALHRSGHSAGRLGDSFRTLSGRPS